MLFKQSNHTTPCNIPSSFIVSCKLPGMPPVALPQLGTPCWPECHPLDTTESLRVSTHTRHNARSADPPGARQGLSDRREGLVGLLLLLTLEGTGSGSGLVGGKGVSEASSGRGWSDGGWVRDSWRCERGCETEGSECAGDRCHNGSLRWVLALWRTESSQWVKTYPEPLVAE